MINSFQKLMLAGVLLGFQSAGTLAAEEPVKPSPQEMVSTAAELTQAAKRAQPGDTIVITEGLYADWRAEMSALGEEDNPIVVRPATPNAVTFTGVTQLDITGTHIVFKGFRFDGCKLNTSPVALNGAQHCRVTECRFRDIVPGNSPSYAALWVQNNAADNRVDHCTFTNIGGRSVQVRIRNKTDLPLRNRIDHNLFQDTPDKRGNGRETIQVGHDQMRHGTMAPQTLVEYNVILRCNGENEVISNKSSGNTYRYNLIKDCNPGWFHLRGGSNCVVEGNRIENCQGGIAVHGTHHRIINNVIVNSRGPKEREGIMLMYGRGKGPDAHYQAVGHCVVANNTLVNTQGLHVGSHHTLPVPTYDNIVVNNIMVGSRLLVHLDWAPETVVENNLFHPTGQAESRFLAEARFVGKNAVIGDPLFRDAAGGDYRLLPESPAIGKGKPSEANAKALNIGAAALPFHKELSKLWADHFLAPGKGNPAAKAAAQGSDKTALLREDFEPGLQTSRWIILRSND